MSYALTSTKNKHGRGSINWPLNGSLYVGINVQKSLVQLGLKIIAHMRKCLPDAEIFKYMRMNAAIARSAAAEAGSISDLGSVYTLQCRFTP